MTDMIAVIGLGYVGLPLTITLANHYRVIGYDSNEAKITKLHAGIDYTDEIGAGALINSSAQFTHSSAEIEAANIYIVTVPTPVHADKTPDLNPLIHASQLIGPYLRVGDMVIYESTVYPGTTEEVCVPILERTSHLYLNEGFSIGYCPERINPGDKAHTVTTISRVISASNPEALTKVTAIYHHVTSGELHVAPSIKVAEASKVIENAQRDVNIAFVNELAIAFHYMGIDTQDVLDAANTKWNFLNFKPGLVGGHCISIDPYYFIYKAEQLGYHSQLLASARMINQQMANFVTQAIIKQALKANKGLPIDRIGILGVTFKENCADLRNSKVFDIIEALKDYNIDVLVHDPIADPLLVERDYQLKLASLDHFKACDGIVVAVGHQFYRDDLTASDLKGMLKTDRHLVFDLKSIYPKADFEAQDLKMWRI